MKSIEWLNKYRDIRNAIKLLKWDIEKTNLELKRWGVDGDLYLNHEAEISHREQKKLRKVQQSQVKSLSELEQLMRKLKSVIDTFEDLPNTVLKLKYIKGMSLEEISKHLGYSHSHIAKLHAEIMRTLKTASKLAKLISKD